MKQTLTVFIAAAALVILFGGEERDNTGEAAWHEGVERIDQYAAEGISQETHDAMAEQVEGTSIWIKGFGDRLERMTQ